MQAQMGNARSIGIAPNTKNTAFFI
nr:hypothetical protein LRH_01443 [Lacticaseibacillus rhamnosus HN001]